MISTARGVDHAGRDLAVEGGQLEILAIHHGYNRKTLAEKLKTDEGTLSKIFNGKQVASYYFCVQFGMLLAGKLG